MWVWVLLYLYNIMIIIICMTFSMLCTVWRSPRRVPWTCSTSQWTDSCVTSKSRAVSVYQRYMMHILLFYILLIDHYCMIMTAKKIYLYIFFLLISVSFYPAYSTEPRARGEKDQALCTYNCIPKIYYTKKKNKITLHNNILLSTNFCQLTITRIWFYYIFLRRLTIIYNAHASQYKPHNFMFYFFTK